MTSGRRGNVEADLIELLFRLRDAHDTTSRLFSNTHYGHPEHEYLLEIRGSIEKAQKALRCAEIVYNNDIENPPNG
jgi:hypothetical protein